MAEARSAGHQALLDLWCMLRRAKQPPPPVFVVVVYGTVGGAVGRPAYPKEPEALHQRRLVKGVGVVKVVLCGSRPAMHAEGGAGGQGVCARCERVDRRSPPAFGGSTGGLARDGGPGPPPQAHITARVVPPGRGWQGRGGVDKPETDAPGARPGRTTAACASCHPPFPLLYLPTTKLHTASRKNTIDMLLQGPTGFAGTQLAARVKRLCSGRKAQWRDRHRQVGGWGGRRAT